MMTQYILEIAYLIASITFIIGLKMMSNPKKARQGNLIAAAGMTIAIIGTIFLYSKEGLTSRDNIKMILIFHHKQPKN
jgi:NAD(P) transhydrogenase subunit beta